ncbi:MAG: pantetheine-phosphate adenylyltransferase [Bacilli bacterium]
MKIACYPGSFDPITNGHISMVNRGLKLFDKVIIIVGNNIQKKYFFNLDERVELARKTFKNNPKVEVVKGDGLSVVQAKKLGCQAIIRGLRMVSDYEYEVQYASINEYIEPDIDMVFLMSRREYSFISSSRIKELYFYNSDVSNLVPPVVMEALKAKSNKK